MSSQSAYWLDRVPTDICERIAAHVSEGGKQNGPALCLGETSARQRRAVLSVMSHKLEASGKDVHSFEGYQRTLRFAALFSHDAAELFAPKGALALLSMAPVRELLTAPSLRRASVSDFPHDLREVSMSTSIRELEICMTSQSSRELMFETLAKLPQLTKIHLNSKLPGSWSAQSWCVFRDPRFFNPSYNALAASCPNPSSLEMTCRCMEEPGSYVWRILSFLPQLREFVVNHATDAPDNVLGKLRSLDSLRLRHGESYRLAVRVGSPVTELFFVGPTDEPLVYLDAKQIAALAGCPRLEKLSVGLKEGTEWTLCDLVSSLPFLQDLYAWWEKPAECEHDDEGGDQGDRDHGCYCNISPGAILRLVKVADRLVGLHLSDVRVSIAEVTNVLNHMSSRLRSFTLPIADQDEEPYDRLEAVVHATITHSPGLRYFDVADLHHIHGDDASAAFEQQRHRLLVALDRLRQRAPYLDPKPIAQAVSWVHIYGGESLLP